MNQERQADDENCLLWRVKMMIKSWQKELGTQTQQGDFGGG